MDTSRSRSACHGRASTTALRDVQVHGMPPHSAEDHSQQFHSTQHMSNTMYQGWWGGAVGLMDNPSALGCWMVAGPEVVRLIKEFEANVHPNSREIRHHDTTPSTQKAFSKFWLSQKI